MGCLLGVFTAQYDKLLGYLLYIIKYHDIYIIYDSAEISMDESLHEYKMVYDYWSMPYFNGGLAKLL